MSEMIERVARALAERSWDRMNAADSGFAKLKYPDGVSAYCEQQWKLYGYDAYQAIKAMREPTIAMEEAGAKGSGEDSINVARGAWEAMIDEALRTDEERV